MGEKGESTNFNRANEGESERGMKASTSERCRRGRILSDRDLNESYVTAEESFIQIERECACRVHDVAREVSKHERDKQI